MPLRKDINNQKFKTMNTNIKHSRFNPGIAMIIIALLSPIFSFAQLRIDWQYCYGAEGSGDYATSILSIEKDFVQEGISASINEDAFNTILDNLIGNAVT